MSRSLDNMAVWEALESTAPNSKEGRSFERVTASKRDTLNHRDFLMKFLEEIDGELSVGELREALEDYS